MEDFLIDFVIGAAAGVAAGIATQWFLNKYQNEIQNWVKANLAGHPAVTRVIIKAQQLSHNTKKVVKIIVGGTVYVLARMIGVRPDGTTVRLTNSGIGDITIVETHPMTPEQIARLTGGQCKIEEDESETSLLQKGFVPEKVAVGMKIIDKNGCAAESYTICDSRKLAAMRMAV